MGAGLEAVALDGRDGVGSAPHNDVLVGRYVLLRPRSTERFFGGYHLHAQFQPAQKQNPARRKPAGLEILEAPRPSTRDYIEKIDAVNTFYMIPALSSFPMSIAFASPRICARSIGSLGNRGDNHTARPV